MWMADNVANGAMHEHVIARLGEEGIPPELASRALASILARPHVFRGLARAWAQLEAWTPGALAAALGDAQLEVTIDRDRDPSYPDTFRRRTRIMPLGELCARMLAGPSGDIYVVAQSHALDRTALRGYLDHTLRVPSQIAASGPWTSSLWMGPAGSITPFHHDAMDILAVQLHGRKRWRTIAPTDRAWLEALGDALSSPYTMRDPQLEEVAGVVVEEHVVDEGDAILVPASTWHHVVAESASVTVSLTQLAPLEVVRAALGV